MDFATTADVLAELHDAAGGPPLTRTSSGIPESSPTVAYPTLSRRDALGQ